MTEMVMKLGATSGAFAAAVAYAVAAVALSVTASVHGGGGNSADTGKTVSTKNILIKGFKLSTFASE